jgi:spore maturation protein CgeB
MTITDVTPAYREWFTEDELLVPTSVNEFHEMVNLSLKNESFNHKYKQAGYKAILKRHTYVHRANLMLLSIGIETLTSECN